MNVFEILDQAVHYSMLKNKLYGNIGKNLSEQEKIKELGLSDKELMEYTLIEEQDKQRLLGYKKIQMPMTKEDNNFGWGTDTQITQIL